MRILFSPSQAKSYLELKVMRTKVYFNSSPLKVKCPRNLSNVAKHDNAIQESIARSAFKCSGGVATVTEQMRYAANLELHKACLKSLIQLMLMQEPEAKMH